jgi:hypothetical protein
LCERIRRTYRNNAKSGAPFLEAVLATPPLLPHLELPHLEADQNPSQIPCLSSSGIASQNWNLNLMLRMAVAVE